MKRKTPALLFGFLFLYLLVSCAPAPEPGDQATDPAGAAGQGPGGIAEGTLSQGGGTTADLAPVQESSLAAHQQGTVPDEGVLADVYFDFDRSELGADARDALQRNSDWIKQNPGVSIEIEGHADNRGTNEYNLALGARRAQAVKDYLVTLGNAPERLSTISYGEELPVCGANSEECWGKNRRAHFVVRTQKPTS